jgi:hypothetical protein
MDTVAATGSENPSVSANCDVYGTRQTVIECFNRLKTSKVHREGVSSALVVTSTNNSGFGS